MHGQPDADILRLTGKTMHKGNSYNIHLPLIGRISIKKHDDKGFSCLVETLDKNVNLHIRCGNLCFPAISNRTWHSLCDIDIDVGDIVSVSPEGQLKFLFKSMTDDNILFMTDKCNYHCAMCPQPLPPDPQDFYQEAEEIINLIDVSPRVLGITGGEPLLNFTKFLNIIKTLKYLHPDTCLQILTNASVLADEKNAAQLFETGKSGMTFCIPIYSAQPDIHDLIVGKKGAFRTTVKALYNIAKYEADIEIRTVITKQNYHHMENLAHFVSMNFPFINHFAVMGTEIIGNARTNINDIFIAPNEYQLQLINCLQTLRRHNICFSIYNHPQCLIPENFRQYSTKAISKWKIRFYEECTGCTLKNDCGGIFFTNMKEYKNIIKPEIPERGIL